MVSVAASPSSMTIGSSNGAFWAPSLRTAAPSAPPSSDTVMSWHHWCAWCNDPILVSVGSGGASTSGFSHGSPSVAGSLSSGSMPCVSWAYTDLSGKTFGEKVGRVVS